MIKILFLLLLASLNARADSIGSQFHFRTGMISSGIATAAAPGSTGGAAAPGFSVMPSFDIEYETFTSDRSSFAIRASLGYDLTTTVTYYLYGGVGRRYYLNARGAPLNASTADLTVIVRPNFRYYVGWDAGVSQIVVGYVSASLQSFTTAVDAGGGGGCIYQLSDHLGIEGGLTVSYAFGFSSVSAAGMVMRILGGAAYSF